jgi:hypothetical protein
VLLIFLHQTSNNQNVILWLLMIITAFVTHHLRDANRRGLWFAPFGSSPALSVPIYILATLLTPYLLKCFTTNSIKYSRIKTEVLEV